jgi:hypothetical protein
VRTVGVSTDGHGRAALAGRSGLTCAAEPGVHPGVHARRPVVPWPGGRGRASPLLASPRSPGRRCGSRSPVVDLLAVRQVVRTAGRPGPAGQTESLPRRASTVCDLTGRRLTGLTVVMLWTACPALRAHSRHIPGPARRQRAACRRRAPLEHAGTPRRPGVGLFAPSLLSTRTSQLPRRQYWTPAALPRPAT